MKTFSILDYSNDDVSTLDYKRTFLKWSSTAVSNVSHPLDNVTIAVKSVKSSFSVKSLHDEQITKMFRLLLLNFNFS